MDEASRQRFDRLFEQVLQGLPPLVHQLLERVPLHVEDYPSPRLMRELGVTRRDELCGLFTGIALTEKSVQHSGQLPDVVTVFREGIVAAAADDRGRILAKNLKEEIRKTILHELAHYHGLDEDQLRELGYE